MITKIKSNIWQICFEYLESCIYLIKIKNQNILIDTSAEENREELVKELKTLNLSPESIDLIILTHNHYDHAGNIELFPNAKIYGGYEDFQDKKIFDINKLNIEYFQIIETPGHTKGGICILYKDILFSGDILFYDEMTGRTDFPESNKEKMNESFKKLKKLSYKILCPGHSYRI